MALMYFLYKKLYLVKIILLKQLRLCSNFPLSFYEFEEKAIVFLELIENSEEIQVY